MGWIVFGGAGLVAIIYGYSHKNNLNANAFVRFFKPFASFFLFFVFLAVLYALFVADGRLPVVLSGNNDIWSYSKFAHLALEPSVSNNIVGYDLFKSSAVDPVPTSYLFLAGLAYFLGKEVVDVLSLGLILILALSACMIKELCSVYWNIRTSLAFLIGLIWVTGAFSFYLAGNYFFAQWIGICIFLAMLLLVFEREKTFWLQTLSLSLLNYLMFMSYPGLFFPSLGMVLFTKGAGSWFSKRLTGTAFLNPGLVSVLYSFPIVLVILCVLDFTHFKAMLEKIGLLSHVIAGWPFRLLNPLLFLEIPYWPIQSYWAIDSGGLTLKMIGYFLLIAGISYLMHRAYKEKKLSLAQFSLSTAFVFSVLVYLSYYAFKGNSYQQWKFAGSVVLPLSFLPLAIVVKALEGQGVWVQRSKHLFFMAIFLGNIFIVRKLVMDMSPFMKKNAPLRELIQVDQDPSVKRVTVDLNGDFSGTMIATQFINRKPLTLLSESYFSANRAAKYTEISKEHVLVSNSCKLFANQNLTMLGSSFCLIRGDVQWVERYSFSFNEPLPSVLGATGLSAPEIWGCWNDGHHVKLDIPVNKKWRGVLVTLKGAPFLAPGIARQRLAFSVRGVRLKKISVNSEIEITIPLGRRLFENGYVSLVIDLPDAVSPSADGSGDKRVIGFGFHSLRVEARK